MRILGISALYHDSAAALIEDGRLKAAAQEERFTRIKHDASFPANAIAWCLEETGCRLSEIDWVVFYEKPWLKFERLLETYLAFAPRGFRSFATAMPVWLSEKLFQRHLLRTNLNALDPDFEDRGRLLFSEHHFSHAASAFYPSPFDRAAVLTIDGVGEWATTTTGFGSGRDLGIHKEIHFPHSLGLLYSAFTYFCGFKVNSGEYKLMGLAPYGTPRFVQTILDNLVDVKPDGSFRLDMQYFDYATGLTMTNARFERLFGLPRRTPDSRIDPAYMDLAASIQRVTEEIVVSLARASVLEAGCRDLCLAGGVALNCVANGRVLRDGVADRLFVQPAAGDAGGALGSALAVYHLHCGAERPGPTTSDAMLGAYLGPGFSDQQIGERLTAVGGRFTHLRTEANAMSRTAQALADGRIVGWFQGRMEFGPRALGNRSILADPRRLEVQERLNQRIKYRESFRPFAPSVPRERVSRWFEFDAESPYMAVVAPVTEQCNGASQAPLTASGEGRVSTPIPAVTHVDGTARLQTVDAETNPRFHRLLAAFEERTGCPVLVNTSFNVRGMPIVCTPEDAFRCFMGCDLDVLVIGDYWLEKADQDPSLVTDLVRDMRVD